MNTVRIPAKKKMEPSMSLNDIDNIWDYIDMYIDKETPNVSEACFDDENDHNDECYDCDDSWEDYDGPHMEDNDWRSDYYDAFEDDPEAEWGRKW